MSETSNNQPKNEEKYVEPPKQEPEQQNERKDKSGTKKRNRENQTIEGYNIVKGVDGWRVVKIVAQTNGRCKFEYLSTPDLRVFAIERLNRILHYELWRDK